MLCCSFTLSAQQYSISGFARYDDGRPIADAIISCTNQEAIQTDVNGYYEFEDLAAGENYVLSIEKANSTAPKDVTILDFLKLRYLILGINEFPSGLREYAFDLNLSNGVSTFDLVFLAKFLRGIEGTGNLGDWIFQTRFDAEQSAPDQVAYDFSSITLNNLSQGFNDLDFIGVHLGNGAYENEHLPEIPNGPSIEVDLIGTATSNGIKYDVMVNEDASELQGIQFTIKWNPSEMELSNVSSNVGNNAIAEPFESNAETGELRILAGTFDQEDLEFTDNKILELEFNFLTATGGEASFGNNPLTQQAVYDEGQELKIAETIFNSNHSTLPAPMTYSATWDQPSTMTAEDGSINLWVMDGYPPYTFEWSNGANTEDVDDLSAGVYYCTITDTECDARYVGPIELGGVTPTEELFQPSEFQIYPTPANDIINIDLNTQLRGKGTISLYNVLGKKIEEVSFEKPGAIQQFEIGHIAQGTYFLQIEMAGKSSTRKISIVR